MCGIYAYIHFGNPRDKHQHVNLKTRGSKEKITETKSCRLAIYNSNVFDIKNAYKPFISNDVYLLYDGKIYNNRGLVEKYGLHCNTNSECEIIMQLYKKIGIEEMVRVLDGEFAFILVDHSIDMVFWARDIFGIKPLYISLSYSDSNLECVELSSAIKAIYEYSYIYHVLPGNLHVLNLKTKSLVNTPYSFPPRFIPTSGNSELYWLWKRLETAVINRIDQNNKSVGFLLSGGLNSSIILCIAMNHYRYTLHNNFYKPHVFTFGFSENASDIKDAELTVNWLEERYGKNCIVWHKVIGSIAEGIENIPATIFALESFDKKTVCDAVPMYMLSNYIAKNTDVRVVMSGDGCDEVFGGESYFSFAPNDIEFKIEILRSLNSAHMHNILRAERVFASNEIEIRVPFLDLTLVKSIFKCPDLYIGTSITKVLLRALIKKYKLVPNNIISKQKINISNGVDDDWLNYVEQKVTPLVENEKTFKYSDTHDISTNTAKYFQIVFGKSFASLWEVVPNTSNDVNIIKWTDKIGYKNEYNKKTITDEINKIIGINS
jgi:asparagine synthase (glutamine-hydrolysing)